MAELERPERLQIMLTSDELAALENWRFDKRMPSRSAAVRELLRRGLASDGFLRPSKASSRRTTESCPQTATRNNRNLAVGRALQLNGAWFRRAGVAPLFATGATGSLGRVGGPRRATPSSMMPAPPCAVLRLASCAQFLTAMIPLIIFFYAHGCAKPGQFVSKTRSTDGGIDERQDFRAARSGQERAVCRRGNWKLADAFEFLERWPEPGTDYQTALRACQRAHDGHLPLSVARDAFAGFARSVKILEPVSTALPWMTGAKRAAVGAGITRERRAAKGRWGPLPRCGTAVRTIAVPAIRMANGQLWCCPSPSIGRADRRSWPLRRCHCQAPFAEASRFINPGDFPTLSALEYHLAEWRPVVAKADKHPFNVNAFLTTVNGGRTISRYRKDQVVYSQGDAADSVFYVQSGKVKVTVVSKQGKEAVVTILGEGAFVGEGCLTGQPRRLATAVAMTECVIMRLEKTAILRVLRREPAFSERFMLYLLTRNARAEEDLVDQLFNSSEKRLARVLLLMANFGKEKPPEPVITKINQQTLAEMVGTMRSRVSSLHEQIPAIGVHRIQRRPQGPQSVAEHRSARQSSPQGRGPLRHLFRMEQSSHLHLC